MYNTVAADNDSVSYTWKWPSDVKCPHQKKAYMTTCHLAYFSHFIMYIFQNIRFCCILTCNFNVNVKVKSIFLREQFFLTHILKLGHLLIHQLRPKCCVFGRLNIIDYGLQKKNPINVTGIKEWTWSSYLQFHSPNGHQGLSWSRPRAWDSVLVFHMWGRGTVTLTPLPLPSQEH